jgi:hypothetical protein
VKNFTVILLRPDYLASDDAGGYGRDIYVARVKAETPYNAIIEAQAEVWSRDVDDGLAPDDCDDYAPVLVLPGHVKPVLWGWQL